MGQYANSRATDYSEWYQSTSLCNAKGDYGRQEKEVRVVELQELQSAGQHIVRLYVPEKEKATRFVEGAPDAASQELIRLLREEARVL